eukprot:1525239-Amphidinium_carterae.4
MTSWATVASTCSKAEAIIAATALRRLRPALGGDHYKCGCAIMQMLKRCNVPKNHPLVVEAVVNKLDLFLEQLTCSGCCGGFAPETLKYYRQIGCDPVEFIEENDALARLVFAKDLLDRILKVENTAELKTVAREIHTLYSTKRSGALLFSSAVKSLVVTEVERIIKEGIEELGKASIDESKYHRALASTSKLLDDLPGVELVGKREVTICYRGIQMSTTVKTPSHRGARRISVSRHSYGGMLPGWRCWRRCQERVLSQVTLASAWSEDAAEGGQADGRKMRSRHRATLSSWGGSCLGIDGGFEVDRLYMNWLVGGSRGKSLKDIWETKCLPSPSTDLATVMKTSKTVLEMARGFATSGVRSEIEAADAMVIACHSGDKMMLS